MNDSSMTANTARESQLGMFQTLLLVESVVGHPYYCIGRSIGIDHSMRRVIMTMTLLLLRDSSDTNHP